jgi:hypothetical protein
MSVPPEKTMLHKLFIAGLAGVALGFNSYVAFAADDVYAAPNIDDIRGKVLVWAAEQPGLDAARQEALQKLWTGDAAPTADDVLDRVIESFALLHEGVARLVEVSQTGQPLSPSAELLANGSPFFRSNVGLFLGRTFVERRMYDEASEVLAAVDIKEAVDPACLLFHRAVASQALLEIKPALESLDALLKRTQSVPIRYSTTAVLMRTELQNLREKSLGEVAKLMSDSERRLDLGRAGEKVQGVQDRIIANLDELIKKLEAQGGGGGGGSGQNNSNQSGSPANDSSVKGTTAPGLTDPKKLSKEGAWGNLPEAEQAKAKNEIYKNFPSNYRHAIDAYSKKLAGRAAKKD